VRRRDRGSAVRLQINAPPGERLAQVPRSALNLNEPDVYLQRRPLAALDFLTACWRGTR